MDETVTIQDLKNKVQQFCDDRDWDQFHDPKELAIGISTEANELLALFRFQTPEQMGQILSGPKSQKVKDELADTLFFILRFAQKNNIDLSAALQKKMTQNDARYPVELIKGKNHKYDEL